MINGKMNIKLAPVVLFVYNRPWHTKCVIEALKNNTLAKKSDLIIFSDGPRDDKAIEAVVEIRRYLLSVSGFRTVKVIERDRNYGLADNIIDGVTSVVKQYGNIIVLEDDVVTSKYFLKYMNDALSIYEDEKCVWQISGSVEPFRILRYKSEDETFFLRQGQCGWGWGTWDDRWEYYKRNPEELLKKYNTKQKIKFINKSVYPGTWRQIKDNYTGKLRTWAVFFDIMILENNGLVLWPKYTLSKNIGFDGSGEHCGNDKEYNVSLDECIVNEFTTEIHLNKEMTGALQNDIYEELKKLNVFLTDKNKIVIYGAGDFANKVYKYCKIKNIYVDFFIVTSNPSGNIDGISILDADSIIGNESIIVAVSEQYHREVAQVLGKYSCVRLFYVSNKLYNLIIDELEETI